MHSIHGAHAACNKPHCVSRLHGTCLDVYVWSIQKAVTTILLCQDIQIKWCSVWWQIQAQTARRNCFSSLLLLWVWNLCSKDKQKNKRQSKQRVHHLCLTFSHSTSFIPALTGLKNTKIECVLNSVMCLKHASDLQGKKIWGQLCFHWIKHTVNSTKWQHGISSSRCKASCGLAFSEYSKGHRASGILTWWQGHVYTHEVTDGA